MITLFTGLPGSGKSYKMVAELWKHKNRYYIIHNIVGFKTEKLGDYGFNWVDYCAQNNIQIEEFFSKDYQIELAKKVKEKYKRNMLIIIDEAHEWFDRNVKLLKMWLSYHRHINQQIYLVAHASRNIPQTYRTFVEVEYRAKSSTFLFLPGYFFYNRIIGGQRAGFIFERKKQSIFALYKSQDISISDKEVKKKNFVIPGLVVVIVLLFMAFLKTPSWIMGKEGSEAKKAPLDSNKAVLGADSGPSASDNIKEAEADSGPSASDNIKEAESEMPFDKKYAFVGQIKGMVIVENRKNGDQYMLHRVPGNYRVLAVDRADYCIVWNGRDEIYTLRNFDRYAGVSEDVQPINISQPAGQEARHQSAYLPGVDG